MGKKRSDWKRKIKLKKYIKTFKTENSETNDNKLKNIISKLIKKLDIAANGNVVWDKIIEIEKINDPKKYVYDFTVPGNDSFMVDNGILVHNTLNTFHHAGINTSVPNNDQSLVYIKYNV